MADAQVNDAFRSTASAAEAMFEKIEQQPKVETVVAPVVEPKVDTPAASATPTAPPSVEPLAVSDDTPIKIKVNGEEKVVTAKEYKEILQRTDVFTQRQQGLAQQQRQLEEHYAQREAYLQQQAQALVQLRDQLARAGDPAQRIVEALRPQAKQQDPNELATIGELKNELSALQQQIIAARQADQQQLAQALIAQQEQVRQEAALIEEQRRFSSEVNKVLNSDDGKMLLAINPKAEAILRYETLQMGGQNTDEAIRDLHLYAKGWIERVRGHFNQQATTQAVKNAQTVMEPPVGHTPPVAQPQKAVALRKDGTIDWDALRARALSMLEQ